MPVREHSDVKSLWRHMLEESKNKQWCVHAFYHRSYLAPNNVTVTGENRSKIQIYVLCTRKRSVGIALKDEWAICSWSYDKYVQLCDFGLVVWPQTIKLGWIVCVEEKKVCLIKSDVLNVLAYFFRRWLCDGFLIKYMCWMRFIC